MNQIKFFTKRFKNAVAGLMLGLALTMLALPFSAQAIIVENLPIETTAYTGFTHRIVLTYFDVTNAAAASINTVTLIPATTIGGTSGNLLSNVVVERFAFVLDQAFTNSATLSTNMQMYVGFGGTASTGLATNDFISAAEVDGRTLTVQGSSGTGPLMCFATNTVRVVCGSTNTLTAIFKTTNGLSGCNFGKITLLFKITDLQTLRR